MLLMIDNYDSFTYNLVQYFAELGAEVEVHRNDEITVEQIEKMNPQHIVVSPGPCTPNEAGISVAAIKHFAGKIPLLGVWFSFKALRLHAGLRQMAPRYVNPARHYATAGYLLAFAGLLLQAGWVLLAILLIARAVFEE